MNSQTGKKIYFPLPSFFFLSYFLSLTFSRFRVSGSKHSLKDQDTKCQPPKISIPSTQKSKLETVYLKTKFILFLFFIYFILFYFISFSPILFQVLNFKIQFASCFNLIFLVFNFKFTISQFQNSKCHKVSQFHNFPIAA